MINIREKFASAGTIPPIARLIVIRHLIEADRGSGNAFITLPLLHKVIALLLSRLSLLSRMEYTARTATSILRLAYTYRG